MNYERLPFWSFFHDIEKALSYERWIDKYDLFLDVLSQQHIIYDKDYNNFITFCKALYLQDYRDEEKFEIILRNAITHEEAWLLSLLRAHKTTTSTQPSNAENNGEEKGLDKNDADPAKEQEPNDTAANRDEMAEEDAKTETGETTKAGPDETVPVYYRPSFTKTVPASGQSKSHERINFLLTDEYFPVSRRQMVKGWQFLRRKEKAGKENGIDLNATITQIARDGLFLEPKYKEGQVNREDAIIIFADYRGSMIAFHELTNRLIATAKGEGGHPRAPVFYFQNYPVGYVYKNSNLTMPVKIKEALLKTNRNFTLAIVISDAGAARGNTDPKAKETRTEMTNFLLDHLNKSCAHTIWLNPMPRHRWKGTAAELIKDKVYLMAPVLDQDSYNFQDTLRTILKQNLKKENVK